MIRFILFLLATVGIAFGAAWLADRPGEVAINWLGYHADTSVAVVVGVIAALMCAVLIVWTVFVYLWTAPGKLSRRSAQRRAARAHHAVSRGLVAIGAGDVRAALRHAREAERHAADQPLTLLLQAQAAQLTGTANSADLAFRAMADRPDTKLLGLHGLFIEAQRRNDPVAARGYAEEAAKAAPSLAWAGQATFDFHCADGDWAGALEALERNNKGGLVDKDTYRRQRAVLLTAQAMSLEHTDRPAAAGLAQEAVRLCPSLTPAAAFAGRLLAESGERRRAGRILEAAWREAPHPEIADAYGDLVPGASARDRLARMRALARLAENHIESRIAVARAALDAREFTEARESLKPLIASPTRRVAALMAYLEEAETGDIGRAREWMARAIHAALDPVWTADGLVAEHWMPVSPATGRLDAFRWRVPVADLTPRGPLLEPAPSAPAIAAPVPPVASGTPAVITKDVSPKNVTRNVTPNVTRSLPNNPVGNISEAKPEAESRPKPAPFPEPSLVETKLPDSGPLPGSAAIDLMPDAPAIELAAASEDPVPGAASVHAPDDPGPEPELPEPQAKPANSGRGRRSWFSRDAAR